MTENLNSLTSSLAVNAKKTAQKNRSVSLRDSRCVKKTHSRVSDTKQCPRTILWSRKHDHIVYSHQTMPTYNMVTETYHTVSLHKKMVT